MKRTRNFTLIELLVTLAIILVLAGILIGGIRFATIKADEAKTRAVIEQLVHGLEKYRSERLRYPFGDGEIKFYRSSGKLRIVIDDKEYDFFSKQTGVDYCQFNFVTATSKASANPLLDAWDEPIKYRGPGGHNKTAFDVWSTGVSGPDDSDTSKDPSDDITNWNNLL